MLEKPEIELVIPAPPRWRGCPSQWPFSKQNWNNLFLAMRAAGKNTNWYERRLNPDFFFRFSEIYADRIVVFVPNYTEPFSFRFGWMWWVVHRPQMMVLAKSARWQFFLENRMKSSKRKSHYFFNNSIDNDVHAVHFSSTNHYIYPSGWQPQ